MNTVLDHLVINTHFNMDQAALLFKALGFSLTPRGYHSLGSINHLIVFQHGYLELIGLPRGTDKIRQEILDSPIGIDGLVLASEDPDATYAEVKRQQFNVQPVRYFSRPVAIDGTEQLAQFATVRLSSGEFPAGRVYFCHHQTPELVWRAEWINQANEVSEISGLTVVSEKPDEEKRRYAKLGELSGNFKLEILEEPSALHRFGQLAYIGASRPERFAAITFRCKSLATLALLAKKQGLPTCESSKGIVVGLPEFATLLEFTQ